MCFVFVGVEPYHMFLRHCKIIGVSPIHVTISDSNFGVPEFSMRFSRHVFPNTVQSELFSDYEQYKVNG